MPHLLGHSSLKHAPSRAATPTPSRPASSHASTGPISPASPIHAAGAQSVNPQFPPFPVPVTKKDEALQKALQEYINAVSDEDKEAFQSAPDIMGRLQQMQHSKKPLISSVLTSRVEKVLQCVKHFIGSLAIFIQQSPEISSLVVGGVNCILTVSTNSIYLQLMWTWVNKLSSLFWDISSSLSVSLQ